jgi:hypothetical protein
VHRVVVAGAAEERQAAGRGQPPRIVRGQAERVGDVEDRDREAAVEVDRRHVVHRDAGHLERVLGRHHRRGAHRQVGALHQVTLA